MWLLWSIWYGRKSTKRSILDMFNSSNNRAVLHMSTTENVLYGTRTITALCCSQRTPWTHKRETWNLEVAWKLLPLLDRFSKTQRSIFTLSLKKMLRHRHAMLMQNISLQKPHDRKHKPVWCFSCSYALVIHWHLAVIWTITSLRTSFLVKN